MRRRYDMAVRYQSASASTIIALGVTDVYLDILGKFAIGNVLTPDDVAPGELVQGRLTATRKATTVDKTSTLI